MGGSKFETTEIQICPNLRFKRRVIETLLSRTRIQGRYNSPRPVLGSESYQGNMNGYNESLVVRAKAGDEWAKERIVKQFLGLAYKFSHKYHAIDDALTIALECIWEAVQSYDSSKGSFCTHVHWKMQGRFLDLCRAWRDQNHGHNRHGHPRLRPAWSIDQCPKAASTLTDQSLWLEEVDTRDMVSRVRDQLNEQQREIFDLRLTDITHREIAEVIGVSESRVFQHIEKIRKIAKPLLAA